MNAAVVINTSQNFVHAHAVDATDDKFFIRGCSAASCEFSVACVEAVCSDVELLSPVADGDREFILFDLLCLVPAADNILMSPTAAFGSG